LNPYYSKLCQLIFEQHPVMREGNLTWLWISTPANHGQIRNYIFICGYSLITKYQNQFSIYYLSDVEII